MSAPRHISQRAFRVAAIGAGKIAEEHLSRLRALAGVRVVGVCDLSPALARFTAERFGVDRFFTDSRALLAETTPEVVHVLTPPHTHAPLVEQALDAGAHVIVEKPAAPTNAEFRGLWERSQAAGRRLIEDHNYRFNRPMRRLESIVASGRLGEVREVEVRLTLGIRSGGRYADRNLPHPSHRLPAGVIHEFITHMCYLALRFLPKWERVSAAWLNVGGGDLFKYDDLDAIIFAADGARGRLRFASSQKPDCFTVAARGSKGMAEADLFQPHVRLVAPRKGPEQLHPVVNQWAGGASLMRASARNFWSKLMQRTPYEGLGTFLRESYAALGADAAPPVTFEDMDGASRLVDALLDERNRMQA